MPPTLSEVLEDSPPADQMVLHSAPEDFRWPTDLEKPYTLIHNIIDEFFTHHAFAKTLARRMEQEASVRFFDFVDHITLPHTSPIGTELQEHGFIRESHCRSPQGTTPLWHPHAHLPRVLLTPEEHTDIAIRIENLEDFLRAHALSSSMDGSPYAPYRLSSIPGEQGLLKFVERHGSRHFVKERETSTNYLQAKEQWASRKREFPLQETGDGMQQTLSLAQHLSRTFGPHLAADAAFAAERDYWQRHNRAGQIQKNRQDALGLGWANHDHHTFRSSREHFSTLIHIFLALGFKKRERYYAGDRAGWGAQILEHPEAQLVIFADVDLSNHEADIEFSTSPLPSRNTVGTVGLWCALHGESILQAGMHHLEAQFNFARLQNDLNIQGIHTLHKFSNFPFLQQAFLDGEQWPVEHARLDHLHSTGAIDALSHEKFLQEGAVGSHLENLERRGYKGFNKIGVDDIISRVDPRKLLKIATEIQDVKNS